jgi:uncharacterized protein
MTHPSVHHAEIREIAIPVTHSRASVTGLLLAPKDARALYVFAHGAGAGMRHPFMGALSAALADRAVATMRYQFPYMEDGGKRPDPQPVLLDTVREAVEAARHHANGLPVFAGGKSMGGRMTTLAAAAAPLADVRGIVLVGFPLHGMGQKPSTLRAEHLASVTAPMLFLQGTRDTLADLGLMREVCDRLGARVTLHVVDGADHSFHVPKRSGRTDEQAIAELADTIARWTAERAA